MGTTVELLKMIVFWFLLNLATAALSSTTKEEQRVVVDDEPSFALEKSSETGNPRTSIISLPDNQRRWAPLLCSVALLYSICKERKGPCQKELFWQDTDFIDPA